MKKIIYLTFFYVFLAGKANAQLTKTVFTDEKILPDCNVSIVNGDADNIIGCGKATTFGHTTTGNKDRSKDDGNVFCNNKSEKEKYTWRKERSNDQNLQVKFAALRMNDVAKIFDISGCGGKSKDCKKALAKNRKKFCGKRVTVKDLNTGKSITVQVMDIMSNNNKLIDLTGGAMKDLGGKGEEPTLSKIQITWANPGLSI